MAKNTIINVQGSEIRVSQIDNEDYISLTDMCKSFDESGSLIEKWLRNVNTLEFLCVWETMYNPNFNSTEFGVIRNQAGLNSFVLSTKKWTESTKGIGLTAKTGRHGGGTFAHKDIAFEFGSWLSPQFKFYLIKEFQRLKEIESNQNNVEWNFKRVLSKANYILHTDAIKEYLIPQLNVNANKEWLVYASEADILNVALFGCTAKMWRDANPEIDAMGKNIRDIASINELAVLSNIESLNSILIKKGIDTKSRFDNLKIVAAAQLKSLNEYDFLKSHKRLSETTYVDAEKKGNIDFKGSFGDAIGKIANAGKPKSK